MTAKTSVAENTSQYETEGGVRVGRVSAEAASDSDARSACESAEALERDELDEKNRGSNEGRLLRRPAVNGLRWLNNVESTVLLGFGSGIEVLVAMGASLFAWRIERTAEV